MIFSEAMRVYWKVMTDSEDPVHTHTHTQTTLVIPSQLLYLVSAKLDLRGLCMHSNN